MGVGVLTLNTYSLRDLQTASALLTQALSEGQSLQSLLDLIGTRVRAIAPIGQEKTISAADLVQVIDQHLRGALPMGNKQMDDRSKGRTIPVCPSCSSGQLAPCRQTSALVGATVLSCTSHCGYSRIVGEV